MACQKVCKQGMSFYVCVRKSPISHQIRAECKEAVTSTSSAKCRVYFPSDGKLLYIHPDNKDVHLRVDKC